MGAAALVHYEAGRVVAGIAEPTGELQDYKVARPAGLVPGAVWGRDYEKMTGARAGTVYHLRLFAGGRWFCDCQDFRWRFRAHRGDRAPGEHCKHLAHGRALKEMLDRG